METIIIKKDEKKLIRLIDKDNNLKSHAILNTTILDDANIAIKMPPQEQSQLQNRSVWPMEDNITVKSAKYENDNLFVTVINIYVRPINIISIGVKYTSNNIESIDFRPSNIHLPLGEKTIKIPCPKGNPFKFVIRTENGTAIGNTKPDLNW